MLAMIMLGTSTSLLVAFAFHLLVERRFMGKAPTLASRQA
jgi:hypothetical protein